MAISAEALAQAIEALRSMRPTHHAPADGLGLYLGTLGATVRSETLLLALEELQQRRSKDWKNYSTVEEKT